MNKKFSVLIKNKIKKYNKKITVDSDKSITHRCYYFAAQCLGISKIKGLNSKDVEATINGLGASLIRVTGSCVGGDLLVSAGDGCAKVNNSGTLQTVIGKVTANTSGSATEDRLIPCVLYCG